MSLMEYISLLWPKEKNNYADKTRSLSDNAADSLDLDGLCRFMENKKDQRDDIKQIFTNLCCDEDVIQYRQDIFLDMISSDKLTETMDTILDQLRQLQYISSKVLVPEDANLWKLFSKFKELECYVASITAIDQALNGLEFRSEGLGRFKESIHRIHENKEFVSLSKAVQSLNIEIGQIQSINLGINLDSSLNPVEATIVSINKTKFKDRNWFKDFIPTFDVLKIEELGYVSKIHRLSSDPRDPVMYHLYTDIERFLKPVVRDLSNGLNQYSHIRGKFLVDLIPEISFYLSGVHLYQTVKANGLPVCIPKIAKKEERRCTIRNIYSLLLAYHMIGRHQNPAAEITLNPVDFDDNGRIFILTGPNRGGKTVYTEAVGLSHILFQAGLFVPGSSALISPVDCIYTHFPVGENQTVEYGRLGEETNRLHEIFRESTRFSLILLNESLASTSFSEALYIAQDIVKGFRYLGARVIFNTHMHELASSAETINQEIAGDSRVVSLVTGMADGKRSYKIEPGAPLGKSYAMDIAEKYGISFNQIINTIDGKNQAAPVKK